MAFAAMMSLENTLELLLYSSHISLVSPSQNIIRTTFNKAGSLLYTLGRLDWTSMSSSRKRLNVLDDQIREGVYKFEDLLESHVLNQIVSQSGGCDQSHPLVFSVDLQGVEPEINSFNETLKKMDEEYEEALCSNLFSEEDEEEEEETAADSEKPKMLGLFDFYNKIKDYLLAFEEFRLEAIPIVGMAGIGKTTVAREIMEDPDISKCFDFCGRVTIGVKWQPKDIQRAILAQLDPNYTEEEEEEEEGHDDIAWSLKKRLMGKKYLIMLDDVWETDVWFELEKSFPDEHNRSRVLLTTRLHKVAERANHLVLFKMPLLNPEESWHLLREKVFVQGLCPSALEKVGKKIADKCEGLPLTIIAVARRLREVVMNLECWNRVLEEKDPLFSDTYEEISKVLYPSYDYLSQHLKPCFLYLGVFPQGYEIATSNLFHLWIVEGFPRPPFEQPLEYYCMQYVRELVSNSLVFYYQDINPLEGIITCRLHSSFWHLCKKESRRSRFFYVLRRLVDAFADDLKSQRRLCIHNNVLFGIKAVHSYLSSDCARGLLCYGPYHQYPVQICFELRFLKVLDAQTIRLYEFPIEVLELLQLTYLALTCNGKLPSSISKLWNLQFLIVRKHMSIKYSCGAPSYLPMEIWDMKELKHIQIVGSDLIHTSTASLDKLLTLLDVSIHSCTEGVLRRLSNLTKLGIRIELSPDDAEPLGSFDHISRLDHLESLTCTIVNPEIKPEVVAAPALPSIFPPRLRKLSLSGMGYPWKEMRKIASFRYIALLKLQNYAFRGPEWDVEEDIFWNLSVLVIEDTDLVRWRVGTESFPCLRHLSIRHCYKWKEIDGEFPSLLKIEVEDCNPAVGTCAKEIGKAFSIMKYIPTQVDVHSSWDDEKRKSSIAPTSFKERL